RSSMTARSTNSDSWAVPFGKVLELEIASGYNNKAVVGGLDRFVQHWAQSMSEFIGNPDLIHELVQASYGDMSEEARARWVYRWQSLLSGQLITPTVSVEPEAAPASAEHREVSGSTRESSAIRQGEPLTQASQPKPEATSSPRSRRASPGGISVDAPVDRLRGVDTKLTARLKRLEVASIRDLLYLFPRRHLDYSKIVKVSELEPDQECTVIGQLWEAREVTLGQQGRLKATEAVLSDETGNVKVTWIGQGYLARSLRPNVRIAISGKVEVFRGQLVFQNPEYEFLNQSQPPIHTGRLIPVYPLTEGLTGRNLRRISWQALSDWLGGVDELLPADMLTRTRLLGLQEAIIQAHFPDDLEKWSLARRRLAFDELLVLQLAVLSRRQQRNQGVEGVAIEADSRVLDSFISTLPFPLTSAQKRCVSEILTDMKQVTPPMNRLLQGEVGSGKTVVVLVALLAAAVAGYQGAIMVPTEVLAEQHFQTVSQLMSGLARPVQEDNRLTVYLETLGRPVSVGLLTGSTRQRARRELTALSSEGNLDLLIGTHALIQSGVELPNLALAVMDEQHRFGVLQRSALRQKGVENPHSLVMSATPIPRTLSLTLYGDLDISTIDELPPGRQEVRTRWLGPERREAAYGFLRKEVQAGRQAFIIYPLIDESEAVEAKAAADEHKRLSSEVFPDLRLGLLHGRLSAKDKDKVMRQFRDGVLDVLISTAVVEVGIDVANATVMLIEGADRFGLSQLHQFRGRVGRGAHQSYCILLSDAPAGLAQERLAALEQIHDGFQLAEVDLELRGPGDFFGTRQSGLPNLRMAQLSDRELLDLARSEATKLIEADPTLSRPEHAELAKRVGKFLEQVSAEFS
ncbi:MAG: ATP-dependent DNA helicase RecG, partial [Dehalococcoidia bacterium]